MVTVGCGGECQIEAGTDCAWYCTTHDRRMGGNVAVRPASCPQGDEGGEERSREGLCEHGIALGSGYCPACYPEG